MLLLSQLAQSNDSRSNNNTVHKTSLQLGDTGVTLQILYTHYLIALLFIKYLRNYFHFDLTKREVLRL